MRQYWRHKGSPVLRAAALWLTLASAGCGGATRQCCPARGAVYGDLARPTSVRVQPAEKSPPLAATRQPTPDTPRRPPVAAPASAPPARSPSANQAGGSPGDTSRYVIQAGDRLEVLYTESWAVEGAYRLLPGDRVAVEYLHLVSLEDGGEGAGAGAGTGAGGRGNGIATGSPLDRQILVAPDGKLALPYVGTVDAAGLTVGELADRLNARYQEFFVEPNILVTLTETGARLEDLRAAIRTAGSRVVLVAPDGSINLPQVGFVPAAGLTLGDLQLELSERYRRTASGWTVTVRLADLDAHGGDTRAAVIQESQSANGPVAANPAENSPIANAPGGTRVQ